MVLRHNYKNNIMKALTFEEKTEQIKVRASKQTQEENVLMCKKISAIVAGIALGYNSFFDDKEENATMWAHFAQMRVFNTKDACSETEAAYFTYTCFWEALHAAEKCNNRIAIKKLYEFN